MVMPIDAKKATKEEIELGLQLLAKKKDYEARVKSGAVKGQKPWKDKSPEEKAKSRLQNRKVAIKRNLLLAKAAKAGITVSAAEIEAEMKKIV